jgi:hypothetical protein
VGVADRKEGVTKLSDASILIRLVPSLARKANEEKFWRHGLGSIVLEESIHDVMSSTAKRLESGMRRWRRL